MSIFVSIASFIDPLLEFTLDGLFEKAQNADDIKVGLVDQSNQDNRSWLRNKPYWKNIRYVNIDPIDARGACWARSLIFSLYEGENYFLQIDSHTHFSNNWDSILIQEIKKLSHIDRPIITTYPPSFDFDENNNPYPIYPPSDAVLVMRPSMDKKLTDTSATLLFKLEHARGSDFVEGFHVAGGFIFTFGSFVENIPYDPYMYFHGEEQNIALRAYTNGWTIFHPRDDSIPIFHLYKKPNEEYKTHHWHPDHEAQRAIKWTVHNQRSASRLISLIRNQIAAPYGLGKERSLSQFIELSNIDYRRYL